MVVLYPVLPYMYTAALCSESSMVLVTSKDLYNLYTRVCSCLQVLKMKHAVF